MKLNIKRKFKYAISLFVFIAVVILYANTVAISRFDNFTSYNPIDDGAYYCEVNNRNIKRYSIIRGQYGEFVDNRSNSTPPPNNDTETLPNGGVTLRGGPIGCTEKHQLYIF